MPFTWEAIPTRMEREEDPGILLLRAAVPGGWFIFIESRVTEFDIQSGTDLRKIRTESFFYPDPAHGWDGSTMALPK